MAEKAERTFMLVKPDGVKRGLIGEVIKRIEQRGLKVIALKMVTPTDQLATDHYPTSDEWLHNVGAKVHEKYNEYGVSVKELLGTEEHAEIGKLVWSWTKEYIMSGPVVAMVIEGMHAIDMVRKIVGHTYPASADVGTIRGDFSVDSPLLANKNKRAIRNLVHASGNTKEAEHEINLWFKPAELHDYTRTDDSIMF